MSQTLEVFVDARMITYSGIGRHIQEHLIGLHEQGCRLLLGINFRDEGLLRELVGPLEGDVKVIEYDSPVYGLREQWEGRRLLRRELRYVDVFWFPQYNAPLSLPSNSVLTIHDLIQFKYRDQGRGRLLQLAASRILSANLRRAGRVVCTSQCVRRELLQSYPAIESRLRLVPNGVATDKFHVFTEEQREAFRQQKGLTRYILSVGNRKIHKNQEMLLRVLDHLAPRFPDLELVIVGVTNTRWIAEVRQWITGGGRVERLRDLGWVSEDDLRGYYACAEAVLCPSYYEGFGLTPLEAMSAGVPVIASSGGAMPEILGEAALIIDPANLGGWVEATIRVLEDESLRRGLVQRGSVRVRELTWTKGTDALHRVFLEAAGRDS